MKCMWTSRFLGSGGDTGEGTESRWGPSQGRNAKHRESGVLPVSGIPWG